MGLAITVQKQELAATGKAARLTGEKQMQSTWFVQQAGKTYGPFDSLRLKKLAAAGKIAVNSGISKSAEGPWTEATRVRGLFPSSGSVAGDAAGASVEDESPEVAKKRSLFAGSRGHDAQRAGVPESPMWYFRGEDGAVTGPFSSSDIEKLVDRNVIRPSTFVLRHGTVKWETAFSAGLFLDDPAQEQSTENAPIPSGPPSSAGSELSASPVERVLWKGQASHHVNYGTYFLCAVGAPFYFPAKWGIRRFRERNAIRYVITTRKVRVESGVDHKQQTDIPLAKIHRVELDTPSALEGTRACNISLFGADGALLTILEGVPLDEAARVISLCESATRHQLNVDASARVFAHQRVEDQRAMRRLEKQRRWAMWHATLRAGAAEQRAAEAEKRARRLKTILGDDCPEEVIERSLAAFNSCPPFQPRRKTSGGGLFGWFGGGKKKTRWVRGFYRNGKWVRPHKRRQG